MVRLLIVDDHPLFRQGLRGWIAESSDFKLVGEARDAEEAMSKVRSTKPDLVLLDLSLPDRSGLDLLMQLRSEMPSLNVLVLSGYPEKDYAIRCLRAGAMGYLAKESAPEELSSAIRKIVRGRKYVSASLADLLATELGGNEGRLPHEGLSDREFQVLCMIGQGKSVTQIAEQLNLSPPTVSTYRTRILEKLKVESTAQLIHYAVLHGLVDKAQ
jgi:two-component system invasion response regulator UvrY